jgi:hypothetical protein
MLHFVPLMQQAPPPQILTPKFNHCAVFAQILSAVCVLTSPKEEELLHASSDRSNGSYCPQGKNETLCTLHINLSLKLKEPTNDSNVRGPKSE